MDYSSFFVGTTCVVDFNQYEQKLGSYFSLQGLPSSHILL